MLRGKERLMKLEAHVKAHPHDYQSYISLRKLISQEHKYQQHKKEQEILNRVRRFKAEREASQASQVS